VDGCRVWSVGLLDHDALAHPSSWVDRTSMSMGRIKLCAQRFAHGKIVEIAIRLKPDCDSSKIVIGPDWAIEFYTTITRSVGRDEATPAGVQSKRGHGMMRVTHGKATPTHGA
jgi:hypothetical protein